LAALGAWALVEPRRARASAPSSEPVLDARMWMLLYVGSIVGVAFGTVVTFYQPLALELGITRLRDLFIGYTLTALAVRVFFGAWLDRFRRQRLAFAAASLYGCVVLATAGLQPGWLLPLGLALGLAHGTLYPVLSALVVEGSTLRQRGARMTYFNGSFNVGMVVSTLGFGILVGQVGYRPVFVLAAALVVSAACVLGALRPEVTRGVQRSEPGPSL
jgi:MFS family permease